MNPPDREPPAGRDPDRQRIEGPQRPEGPPDGERLRRPPALRVFFYYFTTLLLVSFSIQILILGTMGLEAAERWARAEKNAIDVALLLAFRFFLLPMVLFVTSFFARVRDGRPLAELGLAWPRGTFASFLLSGALAALLLGLWRLAAGGLLVFQSAEIAAEDRLPWLPPGPAALALVVVAVLASSLFYEIIFRGYIYSTLRERFSWVHAAGLTNLLFLAFHATDPAAGAPVLINLFLAGLLLAGLRERTGSLAAGVAFQTVWQLMLGTFFSLRLAGYDFPRYRDVLLVGDAELSGGDYGPEGGWLITAALAVGLAAVVAWVERGRPEPASGA